jgi:hypothetical protein
MSPNDSSLREYLREIARYPLLSPEQEIQLGRKVVRMPPTDKELLRKYGVAKRDFCYEGPIDDWPKRVERAATIYGLRAVLEEWG